MLHKLYCWQILFFSYALNFINRCFGSLFWLLGVPIGSLFHKKLGPYWVPISKLGGPFKFMWQWKRQKGPYMDPVPIIGTLWVTVAMLSGAGHCRAYIVIFLQEVCYAQRGCEASCVWRKQEILYVSGAGQCWVNIVYIRTRWQVLGWIFSSPAGISNCLQEQRRVDTSFSVFVFEIAAIFPHRSCAYCTSPRSGQCTYPLPLGSKIL